MLDDQRSVKPLPKSGLSVEAIHAQLSGFEMPEPHASFARAFRAPRDVQDVAKWAFNQFMSDNGFFSLYLPYMQTIEQEVIAMGVSLLHPTPTSTGNFTSGGTESNFSGIHAAREWAKVHKPHVTRPNCVAPHTIHPSFQKGAHYLGIEVITTELDANGRGIAANIDQAINDQTIMVAASAPTWHFGRIDPIPEIGAVAQRHGLWMHVDACVGGYINPFLEKLGEPITPWDFRVPGVMSIAADLHKFGYCLKPASTIYFREAELQKYHYVAVEDHYLGTYKLAGFSGSRSAGPIFAAWAVMNYLGEEGYLRLTRRLLDVKARLKREIEAMDGLRLWDVDVMPLQFQSDKVPTEAVYQGLVDKGWIMLGLHAPPAVTIALDPAFSDADVDLFLKDLREVNDRLLRDGGGKPGDIRYA